MLRRTLFVLLIAPLSGCVERTMTIKSDPPGALVYLNDQEIGRTPFKRDFLWYGNYEVEVRKEGYQTLKTERWVKAPLSQWVPFDLITELQPFTITDNHDLFFKLNPDSPEAAAPGPLMARAEETKSQLESSSNTRVPTTRPTTQKSQKRQ